jgi:hypothetical protein
MQKKDSGSGCFQQPVSANSLHEAEQAALQLLSEHFPGKVILLVHIGSLVYDAYEVSKPIAQVSINAL